jgi:hypothetical protein
MRKTGRFCTVEALATNGVALRLPGKNFASRMKPHPALPRSQRTEVNKQPFMDNKTDTSADSRWQSLRLGLGAALLIAVGLGLMLADGTIHPSKALSSVFAPKLFAQSK